MDIALLKTFLEVAKTRHFGRAAENLYITQAAVSARIKQIEDDLGVPLFIRMRNNIQLTAQGERLHPHAETMLHAWSRARLDVALKQQQKDQISIGSTAGLWNYAFQNKLATIFSHFPDTAIRAVADTPEDIIKRVEERTLDIGILFDAPSIPNITTQAAGKVKLILASTVANASSKNAVKENYIYVDWGTAFNMFHADKFSDVSSSILHTSMASMAESFMNDYPASAYLPESMVQASNQGKLKPVKGAPSFSREISLIFRTNSERMEQIKQILPLLIDHD